MFDWAMESMDIWASVNIESRNPKSLGRAYTCGVSNMGRYPFETQVQFHKLEMRFVECNLFSLTARSLHFSVDRCFSAVYCHS